MKTATKLKQVMHSQAALYRMDPPYESHEFVIVSAKVVAFTGPETYAFPAASADSDSPSDWVELDCSFRGGISHAECLQRAGYEIK